MSDKRDLPFYSTDGCAENRIDLDSSSLSYTGVPMSEEHVMCNSLSTKKNYTQVSGPVRHFCLSKTSSGLANANSVGDSLNSLLSDSQIISSTSSSADSQDSLDFVSSFESVYKSFEPETTDCDSCSDNIFARRPFEFLNLNYSTSIPDDLFVRNSGIFVIGDDRPNLSKREEQYLSRLFSFESHSAPIFDRLPFGCPDFLDFDKLLFVKQNHLAQYLALVQQLIKSGPKDRDLLLNRIKVFCTQMYESYSKLFVFWFHSQIIRPLDFTKANVDSIHFMDIIKSILYCASAPDLPISHDDIVQIVDSLYPNFNIVKLFELIESCKLYVQSQLMSKLSSSSSRMCNSEQIWRAIIMDNRHCDIPLLDLLLRMALTPPNLACKSKHLSESRTVNTISSSLAVFCFRTTIYHYLRNTVYKKDDQCDMSLDHQGYFYFKNAISSRYMAENLYQLAIHYALLAAVLGDKQFLERVMHIKVSDLNFGVILKRVEKLVHDDLNRMNETTEFIVQMTENMTGGDRKSVSKSDSEDKTASEDSLPDSVIQSESGSANLVSVDYDLNNNSDDSFDSIDNLFPSNQQTSQILNKRDLIENIKSQTLSLQCPSKNRYEFLECSVCYESKWLFVRSCCQCATCIDCLTQYYTSRVRMGCISIECIGAQCKDLVYRQEVSDRLSVRDRELYTRLLLEKSTESDRAKPCPQCNKILTVSEEQLAYMSRSSSGKLLNKLALFYKSQSFSNKSLVFRVKCEGCQIYWCFKCHSPWHEGISCKQFVKGDTLLRNWAKDIDFKGQANAQKCPRCKIYIQRASGCDHMQCIKCQTDFCYKCGDRLRHMKFFGDHYSRLSILGCKYRYKPNKPLQRKLVRGTIFGGKLIALPILTSVCLCAGAVVLVLGMAALPLFGGVQIYRRLSNRSNISFPYLYDYQVPFSQRSINEQGRNRPTFVTTPYMENRRFNPNVLLSVPISAETPVMEELDRINRFLEKKYQMVLDFETDSEDESDDQPKVMSICDEKSISETSE